MFGFSLGHMLILLVVVLLFNARRLPELGSALGKGIGAFKKGLEGKSHEDDPLALKDPYDPNHKDS
ncbi:MAG: twin-arginine translocase TatA/TatE family subunit [Cryobacterium sp.]|nr:twin-arginine translocase TatA/TatE family subunit [Oligoflexia bacterium]